MFFRIIFYTFLFSPLMSLGSTFYVSQKTQTYMGNDDRSCEEAKNITTPKLTIASGLDCVFEDGGTGAGHTLSIRAGIYDKKIDSNDQKIPTGTRWEDAPVITNYLKETVILKPGGGVDIIGLAHSYIKFVIFNGLVLDGSGSGTGVSLWGGANNVRIQNSEIKNVSGGIAVIYGPGATNDNQFVNLKVHDTGLTGAGHGFYIQTSGNLVDGCEVFNNQKFGIQVYNGYDGERADNNIIRNNIVYNSALGPVTGGGITLNAGNGNLVYNNIVYNNRAVGIDAAWRSPAAMKIYNNTVYNNLGPGIFINSGVPNSIIQNNIVFQNGSNIIDYGSGTTISNNLTTDPKFMNVGSFNFALQKGSPAIDTGTPITQVSVDIAGVPRPQGSAFDIGAYEFVSGTAAPKAPTNLRVN